MSVQERLTNWWAHRRDGPDMPATLVHPNNPVLHAQEMQEYADCLLEVSNAAETQRTRVLRALRALKNGRTDSISSYYNLDHSPELFSLAHVLEFMLALGKCKLRIMHLNIAVVKRFKSLDRDPNQPERNEL